MLSGSCGTRDEPYIPRRPGRRLDVEAWLVTGTPETYESRRPRNVAFIVSGKRVPNLDVLVHIAEITDVSIDYLIFGDNKEPNSLQLTLERLNKSYPKRNVEHALMLAEYYLKLEKGLFDTKNSTN